MINYYLRPISALELINDLVPGVPAHQRKSEFPAVSKNKYRQSPRPILIFLEG